MSTEQWGFPEEQPRQQPSRGPLYFLIGSGLVLLIALIAVVMTQIIGTGRDVADAPHADATTTASEPTETDSTSSEPATTEDSTSDSSGELQTAQESLNDLGDTTSCTDVGADTSVIYNFVNLSVENGSWNADAEDSVFAALQGIDGACSNNKPYVIELQNTLMQSDAPPQLNSLVADATWITPAEEIPADAVTISGTFTTGLENIQCQFTSDGAECTIYNYNFTATPETCQGNPLTFSVNDVNGVSTSCQSVVSGATAFNYGTTLTANNYACTLSESGVRCWSALSGEGFELNRGDGRIF